MRTTYLLGLVVCLPLTAAAQSFPPLQKTIELTKRIRIDTHTFSTMLTSKRDVDDLVDLFRRKGLYPAIDSFTRKIAKGEYKKRPACFCDPEAAMTFLSAKGTRILYVGVHDLDGKHRETSLAYLASKVKNSGFQVEFKAELRNEIAKLLRRFHISHLKDSVTYTGTVKKGAKGYELHDEHGRGTVRLDWEQAQQHEGKRVVIAARRRTKDLVWVQSAKEPGRNKVALHVTGKVEVPTVLSAWRVRVNLAGQPFAGALPRPGAPTVLAAKSGTFHLDVCKPKGGPAQVVVAWIDRNKNGKLDDADIHAVSSAISVDKGSVKGLVLKLVKK